MRLPLTLFALLAAATAEAYYPSGRNVCAASTDFGSNAWITYPAQTGCDDATQACDTSTTDRLLWTQDRIAQAGRTIVYLGGVEDDLDLPGKPPGGLYPDYRPPESSAFALNFSDGRENLSTLDLLAYMQGIEARVPAGRAQPIKTFAMRWDLLFREDLSRIGEYAPNPDWLLRTDRTLANVAASYGGGVLADTDTSRCGGDGTLCAWSPCRAPTEDSIVSDEVYGAAGTTLGCGRPYDGTSNKERGARLDELAEDLEAGLGESAVYYVARPPSNAKVFHPYAVLANMLDPGYQAAAVAKAQRAISLGYDAVDFPRKDQYFIDQVGGFSVQHWPDTSDALGGYSTMAAAVAAQTIFSGPPELPDGTPWGYAQRKLAEVQLSRLLDTAGVPTVRIVNPYWYESCPKSFGSWDTTYDDAACTSSDTKYDDPASASDEEDAYQREIVARADYVLISTGGKPLSGSIGSGGGSGWTYGELKAFLESLPSPDGTPPVVLGYSDGAPWSSERGIPPAYCADPDEDNPETDLPTCGNSTIESGEECDDGNTTSGDGCDKFCRLPDVFVIAGQSNAVGYSTQGADVEAAPRVTSPDPVTGLSSSNYRYRYTDPGESAGGAALATLNDFPCADAQCTGTECTGTNRTAAGHPDTNAGDGDGTCSCYCGVHGSAFGSWEGGSPWPTFAQRYMQDVGREVLLVDVTMPGTSLVLNDDGAGPEPLWDPNATCSGNTDYNDEVGDLACGLFRAADLAGVEDRVQAVLFVQGEDDASGAVSGSSYKTALKALSDKINAMYGRTVPLVVAPLSNRANGSDACSSNANLLAIRTAQLEAIAEDADIYQGPTLDDLPLHDGGTFGADLFGGAGCVHYQDQQTHGERWYEAVRSLLTGQAYDGGAAATPPSAPDLVADFVASPLQGTSTSTACVAPCVVHLDATGTTSTETTRPFHEIDYQWDCGNPSGGTYVGSGYDKNAPRSPVTGCVYDDPGTYTVTLTARDSAGNVDQETRSVTVADPLATYGSSLFCVRSAATGDFRGCPLDTNDDGTCDQHAANCFTQSNAATAFTGSRTGPVGANLDAERGALYFRRGDTFSSLGSITGATGTGPATMGAFGNGPRPIISGVTSIAANSDWTFASFEGVAANPDTAEFFAYGTSRSGVTVYDVYVHGGANCGGTTSGGFGDLLGFVDSECEVDPTGTWSSGGGGSNLFFQSDRFLLLGNRINGGRTREFNLRTVHAYKTAVQYNLLENPDEARNNVQIRAWASASPPPAIDRYVVISDNLFRMPANATASMVIRITQDNAAGNPSTGNPLGTYDHLIERNFFQFQTDATIAGMASGLVQVEGGRVTVRNNVLDLRGPMTSGSVLRFFQQASNIGGCESCVNDTNVVQGNVLYHDQDYNQDVDFCNSATGTTGHVCEGNLVYRPLDAVVGTPDTGSSSGDDWVTGPGWTQSGNYRTGTNPLAATVPAHASTSIESFQLSPSSAARNVLATPSSPFLADAGGRFRPASTSYDAGAWEEGAVGHAFEENLVGVNSEKLEYDEEAIVFADAINDSAQWRTLANPTTSSWESFWQSYEEDRVTTSAVAIPVNQLGWPSVDLPYDPDGAGGNDPVVARMELMKQDAAGLSLASQTIDIEAVSGSTFDLDDTDASNDAFTNVVVGQKILVSGFATNGTVTATITAKASNGQVTATGARSTGSAATAEVGSGISITGLVRPIGWPRGTYTLRFDGTGTVVLGGDAAATTCTGTDQSCAVVIEPTTAGVDLFITSSDPGNAGDPITNVDLLLPGYTDEHQFYEPFVDMLRPFGFVRTLNFVQANHYPCSNLEHAGGNSGSSACQHTWAGRTDPENIQSTRRGIAWEHQISLANEAGVGLWVTIPHAADDTYVTNLATMLRDDLQGPVYMELSNETWNGGFEQFDYFTAIGIDDHTPDWTRPQAYVNRSAEVADIFDGIFTGADAARLTKVLGSQYGSTGITTGLISAMNSATYNPTGSEFDAIAIAPYFAGSGSSVTAFLDSVDANVAALETLIDSHFSLIDAEGLEMQAYEGGPLITGADAISILASDDPRMEGIIEDLHTLWFANGGRDGALGFLVRDFQNGGAWRYSGQPIHTAPKARGYMRVISGHSTTLAP